MYSPRRGAGLGAVEAELFGMPMIPCAGGAGLKFDVREGPKMGFAYAIRPGPIHDQLRATINGNCGGTLRRFFLRGLYDDNTFSVEPTGVREDALVEIPETGQMVGRDAEKAARYGVEVLGATWATPQERAKPGYAQCPGESPEMVGERVAKLAEYGVAVEPGGTCDPSTVETLHQIRDQELERHGAYLHAGSSMHPGTLAMLWGLPVLDQDGNYHFPPGWKRSIIPPDAKTATYNPETREITLHEIEGGDFAREGEDVSTGPGGRAPDAGAVSLPVAAAAAALLFLGLR